jgi:hypothetical protein
MVDDTALAFRSIANYLWAFCSWNRMQRQADPRLGVERWSEFISGVKVLAANETPEPRREMPLSLLIQVAEAVDRASFREVNAIFFLIASYFTFSRSECPCPKSFSGQEQFDEKQHWQVRDFCIRALSTGAFALFVRFKRVKQDARIQRPEVRGDGSDPGAAREGGSDWSIVGDIPGHVLSPFMWYRLLMSFYPNGRDPAAPMFLSLDRIRPYIYSAALADVKMLVGKVQEDTDFGIHSARVGGYNASLRSNGEELTVAHGLWRSRAHSRYQRWTDVEVAGIVAAMTGEDNAYVAVDAADGRPFAVQAARAVRLNQAALARGRGGRTGRGGRGLTGGTVMATLAGEPAATGRGADDPVATAAAALAALAEEPAVAAAAGGDGGGAPSPLQISPPSGWLLADDGRYMPPPHLSHTAPQATVVAAWAMHRQMARLATNMVGTSGFAVARTRHGV